MVVGKDAFNFLLHLEKSFYSLEYTRAEMSEDGGDQTVTTFEDYSKIIEELQSHRREIEKLQATSTSLDEDPPNCLTLVAKSSSEFEGRLYFPSFMRACSSNLAI